MGIPNFGSFFSNFSFGTWQVFAIVGLLFLLILTLAQVRRHFIDWSFKGGIVGFIFGFILALILEGFLLVNGKTFVISMLGWKNPPKPLNHILEIGREKLIQVLGATDAKKDNPQ